MNKIFGIPFVISVGVILVVSLFYFKYQRKYAPARIEKNQKYCDQLYESVCLSEKTDSIESVFDTQRAQAQIESWYRELLRRHSTEAPQDTLVRLANKIYTSTRVIQMTKAFEFARHAIQNELLRVPVSRLSETDRGELLLRLNQVRLDVDLSSKDPKEAYDFLQSDDIQYARLENGELRLRMGGAYVLVGHSWFNLVFTIAHELAHAIDPCELSRLKLSHRYDEPLVQCFLALKWIQDARCDSPTGQQISEAFADYLGAITLGEAFQSYRNEFQMETIQEALRGAVLDLCTVETHSLTHPNLKTRLDGIIGQNPKIRKALRCEAGTYCGL